MNSYEGRDRQLQGIATYLVPHLLSEHFINYTVYISLFSRGKDNRD